MNNCSFEYSIGYFPVAIRPLLSRETLSATLRVLMQVLGT
jgi:hypothetical protein